MQSDTATAHAHTTAEASAAAGRYFDDMSRRNWGARIGAVVIAAALNLTLFFAMPLLMDPNTPPPALETVIPQVRVVRFQRPETSTRRETPKPEPPAAQPEQAPAMPSSPPPKIALSLPFDINPQLPAGPGALPLPPMEGLPAIDVGNMGGPFAIGQLDAPLTPLARISPVYPLLAKRRGIEGEVQVAFVVDQNGTVKNIEILSAIPQGFFEQSVRNCVSKWRFKPGTVGGEPVETKVETAIKFELE